MQITEVTDKRYILGSYLDRQCNDWQGSSAIYSRTPPGLKKVKVKKKTHILELKKYRVLIFFPPETYIRKTEQVLDSVIKVKNWSV